jgi:hypothetical protein
MPRALTLADDVDDLAVVVETREGPDGAPSGPFDIAHVPEASDQLHLHRRSESGTRRAWSWQVR